MSCSPSVSARSAPSDVAGRGARTLPPSRPRHVADVTGSHAGMTMPVHASRPAGVRRLEAGPCRPRRWRRIAGARGGGGPCNCAACGCRISTGRARPAAADLLVRRARLARKKSRGLSSSGPVWLEALACGTAVAAFPVAGPLDVVGGSDGGALDDDLRRAALRSLEVPRARARARAMNFEWNDVCRCFLSYLVPVRLPGLRGRLVLAS